MPTRRARAWPGGGAVAGAASVPAGSARAPRRRRLPCRTVERAADARRGAQAARPPKPAAPSGWGMRRGAWPSVWLLRGMVVAAIVLSLLAGIPEGYTPPVLVVAIVLV